MPIRDPFGLIAGVIYRHLPHVPWFTAKAMRADPELFWRMWLLFALHERMCQLRDQKTQDTPIRD